MTAQQIAAPVSRFWQGFGQAMQHWARRNDLSQLDDRMLQDLGISRAQAAFDAERRHVWHVARITEHDDIKQSMF